MNIAESAANKKFLYLIPRNPNLISTARQNAQSRLKMGENDSIPARELEYEIMQLEPECVPIWRHDGHIIIRDETNPKCAYYAIFSQYTDEFASKITGMHNLSTHFLIHEVIFTNVPQRLHMDIDCCDPTQINLPRIYMALHMSAVNHFGFDIPFDVYDSSGLDVDTGKTKVSIHLISAIHCACNGSQAATVMRRMCAHFNSFDAQWIDRKYLHADNDSTKSNNLRVCWATKKGRTKRAIGTIIGGIYESLREDWLYYDSLVSHTISCQTLSSLIDEEQIIREDHKHIIDSVTNSSCDEILPETITKWVADNGFGVDQRELVRIAGRYRVPIIPLKRLRASMCPICFRVHDRRGGYIKRTTSAYVFGCLNASTGSVRPCFTIAHTSNSIGHYDSKKCNLIIDEIPIILNPQEAIIAARRALDEGKIVDEIIVASQVIMFFVFTHADTIFDICAFCNKLRRATGISASIIDRHLTHECADGDICLIVPIIIAIDCNEILAEFLVETFPRVRIDVYTRGSRIRVGMHGRFISARDAYEDHFAADGLIFGCPLFAPVKTRLGAAKRIYDPKKKKTVRLRRDDWQLFKDEYDDAHRLMQDMKPCANRFVHIANSTEMPRLIFVRAPLGSGKTTELERIIRDENISKAHIVFISPRRTYSTATGSRFAEFGFRDYRDIVGTIDLAKIPRVIIQIDSLARLVNVSRCNLLILDEIESILSQAENCGTPLRIAMLEQLRLAICQSERVIAMDGCLSKATRWFIHRLSGAEAHEITYIDHIGEPIRRIAEVRQVSAVCPGDIGIFVADVRCRVDHDERVVCVISERRLAEALRDTLESGWCLELRQETAPISAKPHRIMLFTGDDYEVRDYGDGVIKSMFSRKLDAFANITSAIMQERPDVLIYTLTLTAGVDINVRNGDDTAYFTSFVHWYSALVDPIEFIQATSRVRTFAKNEGTLYMDVGAQGWTMTPTEYMRMIGFTGNAFANGFTMPLTMQMECFLGARKHSLMARGAQVMLRELARFGWLLTFKSRLAVTLDENSRGMKSMQVAASISNEEIARCILTEEHLRLFQRDREHELAFKCELKDPAYRIVRHKCKIYFALHATLDDINKLTMRDIKAIRMPGVLEGFFQRAADMRESDFSAKMRIIHYLAGERRSAVSGDDLYSREIISAKEIVAARQEAHATSVAIIRSGTIAEMIDDPESTAVNEKAAKLGVALAARFKNPEGAIIELNRDSAEITAMCAEIRSDRAIIALMNLRRKTDAESLLRPLLLIAGYELTRRVHELRNKEGKHWRSYFLSIRSLHTA